MREIPAFKGTECEGDAVAAIIYDTLTDRGVPAHEAAAALIENPPSWDSFARTFVDPYEDELNTETARAASDE